jgi:aspartate/methionine/tyrosine aminotransferase
MSAIASQLSRMETIQSPVIPLIGELIENHPGTISLGQGVVAYAPPKSAISALENFLINPQHKYQSVTGIPELVNTISDKLRQDNQIIINDDNCIVVTAGSNMGFLNAILAITQPGDEIILNTPYYFNHEMAIRMIDCHPILVATDEHYQPKIDNILQAITPKTKAIVTISPNNPTGVVYDIATLQRINQICQELAIYHISDEAYEYFTYNQIQHTSPASFPNSTPYTISLFSLSKTYGFASWRIGYMIIPRHLLLSIKKIQDTNLICPPVISQYAAKGALQAEPTYLQTHLAAINNVRNIVQQQLKKLPSTCQIATANGAFYFFLKVQTTLSDLELVTKLIQEYRVAVIPGSTFGMDNGCYLRVAYGALTPENASLGITRLIKGISQIIQ